VRLIVGKATLLLPRFVVLVVFTQTDIDKFFLASRNCCGGDGLAKSRCGGGG